MNANYIFSYVTLNSVKPFHSCGLQICKVIRTKGRFYKGKLKVHIPRQWLGKSTMPPFHSFATPIWRKKRHVKMLYLKPKRFNRDSLLKSIAGRAFLRIPF